MQIYMDVCCYNRPFDDFSSDRVYLEAEAVLSIISRCENGDWVLFSSGVIDYELSKLLDLDRLEQVQDLYSVANKRINLTKETEMRAAYFLENGLKSFDSLHLALAETGGADIFLSTDDHLLRVASRMDLKIKVANPVNWLMEVTSNEC